MLTKAAALTSFESLVDTYRSILPHARLEPGNVHDDFQWRGDRKAGDGVSLWQLDCSAGWVLQPRCDQISLCLFVPTQSAMEAVIGAQSMIVPAGAALITGMGQTTTLRDMTGNSRILLRWTIPAVEAALAAHRDPGSAPLAGFKPATVVAGVQGTMLHHLVRSLAAALDADDGKMSKPAALLNETLLNLLLGYSFVDEIDPDPTDTPLPRRLKAAIEVMRNRLHEPLTIGEIAQAAGLRSRALQAGFQRHLDTTPLAFLRELRLEAVRAELRSPENRLPVHEVAMKWGFSHMGRFAAHYRRAFGELPSRTSGRGRPARRA